MLRHMHRDRRGLTALQYALGGALIIVLAAGSWASLSVERTRAVNRTATTLNDAVYEGRGAAIERAIAEFNPGRQPHYYGAGGPAIGLASGASLVIAVDDETESRSIADRFVAARVQGTPAPALSFALAAGGGSASTQVGSFALQPNGAYVYAPDRKGKRPAAHLATFRGTLQVDGYGGFRALEVRPTELASLLPWTWQQPGTAAAAA